MSSFSCFSFTLWKTWFSALTSTFFIQLMEPQTLSYTEATEAVWSWDQLTLETYLCLRHKNILHKIAARTKSSCVERDKRAVRGLKERSTISQHNFTLYPQNTFYYHTSRVSSSLSRPECIAAAGAVNSWCCSTFIFSSSFCALWNFYTCQSNSVGGVCLLLLCCWWRSFLFNMLVFETRASHRQQLTFFSCSGSGVGSVWVVCAEYFSLVMWR